MRFWAVLATSLLGVALAPGCSVAAGLYGDLGSLLGSNSNDSCDRRYGKQPEVFCQEIVNTVAGPQFRDDCRNKFQAKTNDDICPRDHVVGGCAIDKKNQDGSTVTDWFYDVSFMLADAAAPDAQPGDETDAEAPSTFPPQDIGITADDVRAKCADRGRYSDGAHFVTP